jgi:hypothetical protein
MSRTRRRAVLRLVGFGCLAWLAAIAVGYYILHRPFAPEVAFSAVRAILDLLIAGAVVAVAGGLGKRLVGEVHPDRLCALCLQASLGLGVLSLLILGIAIVGGVHRWVAWLLLAVGILLLRRPAAAWLSAWGELGTEWRRSTRFGRGLIPILLLLLFAALLEALAPPVHFDALVYHLTLPQEFVRSHTIAATGGSPYWGMPLGTEMLYTWALALGREQTAAVLGWMVGFVCLAGVIGLARSFHRSAGWVAVAALLSGETLAASLGWGYADWTAALHGCATLVGLDAWRRATDDRPAAVAGAAAAFALGAKYAAALAIAAGATALVIFGRGRRRAPWIFLGAAVLLSAPWFLKNWVYTGSPLYPVFGTSTWIDPARQGFYRGTSGGIGPASLILPLAATLQGVEGAPGFAASIGPLLLALTPAALFARRDSAATVRAAALFLVVGWAGWAAASLYSVQLIQSRLYYVFFPAWAVVAGAGFAGLLRLRLPRLRFGLLAQAIVLISLAPSAIWAGLAILRDRPQDSILGIESDASYRSRRLGLYEFAMQSVERLGPEASVLSLWEARGLACRPACRPDYWLDRWFVKRTRGGDPSQILDGWRDEGVTHLLLYRAGAEFVRSTDSRYGADDWQALEDLLAALRLVERIGDAYELYEVGQ